MTLDDLIEFCIRLLLIVLIVVGFGIGLAALWR